MAVLGLGGALLAVWLVYHWFPNEDRIIRQRFQQLAQLASTRPDESRFKRLANARRIADFFSQDAILHFTNPGPELIDGRQQLLQTAITAKLNVRQARIQFLDLRVERGADGVSATVDLTVLADVNDEKNAVAQEVRFTLAKIEGEWLLTRMDPVKSSER